MPCYRATVRPNRRAARSKQLFHRQGTCCPPRPCRVTGLHSPQSLGKPVEISSGSVSQALSSAEAGDKTRWEEVPAHYPGASGCPHEYDASACLEAERVSMTSQAADDLATETGACQAENAFRFTGLVSKFQLKPNWSIICRRFYLPLPGQLRKSCTAQPPLSRRLDIDAQGA